MSLQPNFLLNNNYHCGIIQNNRDQFRTLSTFVYSFHLHDGFSNTVSVWACIPDVDRAMIKNERGVTIRARADEVFSIPMAALRDRLYATKVQKQFIGCFVFLVSRDTTWQIQPANPFHNVSCSVCSLQKLAIHPTQPPFRWFNQSLFLSLFLLSFSLTDSPLSIFPPFISIFFCFPRSPFFPIRCFNKRIFTSRHIKKRFMHISTCNWT